MTLESIYREALKLSPDDRERLMEMLGIERGTRAAHDVAMTAAQRADLERRIAEDEVDESTGERWEIVKEQLLRRAGARASHHTTGAA